MEIEFLKALAQYGVLGLWTASLLWKNHKQNKSRDEREERAREDLRYHQEQIVERLKEQERMLEKALEKLDDGLLEMRNKYQEERIARMHSDSITRNIVKKDI